MLFGITPESCSASEWNRVHLRPDSPGWYAAHYFLYADEHDQVQQLRRRWKEQEIYRDIENFFNFYVRQEVGGSRETRHSWIEERLATEDVFWEQERKD
jgi:hypothetical protein